MRTGWRSCEFLGGEGEGDTGLKRLVEQLPDIDARALATFDLGEDVAVREWGATVPTSKARRWFRQGWRAGTHSRQHPRGTPPSRLTLDVAKELRQARWFEGVGNSPGSGLEIVVKNGRFGPYVTEDSARGCAQRAKPKTASLFKSMEMESVALADALQLLTLPRVVGTGEDGEQITRTKRTIWSVFEEKGTDSRSIESEEQLLTLTEAEARAIYAQPKTYGRRAAAKPLKELGEDPTSGKPIVAKEWPLRCVRDRWRVQRGRCARVTTLRR